MHQYSSCWDDWVNPETIYTSKELKSLCTKSIFKNLSIKLTKESVFSTNDSLIKQIDRCPIGGPISVVFSDMYMCKTDEDILKPLKPLFYKCYVDVTHFKRKRYESDTIFDALNSYHPEIKFTQEQNPKKILESR